MAEVTSVDVWQRIAIQLQSTYKDDRLKLRANSYFHTFTAKHENPLVGLEPLHTKFFGPKVCLLFIVGKPYGESGDNGLQTVNWPPNGFNDSKVAIRDYFKQWASFQLNFWGDGIIIQRMKDQDAEAGVKFETLMKDVFSHFKDECSEMASFGWKWRGQLDAEPPLSEFTDVLDRFYHL